MLPPHLKLTSLTKPLGSLAGYQTRINAPTVLAIEGGVHVG
jgi:hypothetical protein